MSLKFWQVPFAAGAALAYLSGAAVAADRSTDIKVVEEIVAKVNSEIITRGELEKTRLAILASAEKQGLTGPALDEAVNKVAADALRDQIDQLLLVQKGKDMN